MRGAATLGGNLAAARLMGLESDPATVLMAAGAVVTVAGESDAGDKITE